ncbi:hypothetical protein [Maricaulis maris]|uniref:Uncharacterized protein n=1 Tax=Maricaulis maris TaxID=74318 RepID=A0A495CZQ2_9PROT|nr:hypothetical protein [Maricaulis maris]RKQ94240.1 hypothetical protein C7435_3214 [Maricaulis maris]
MTTDLVLVTEAARTLWRRFLKRLDWSNRTLGPDERAEARAEAAAHMREAMGETTAETEAGQLADAIAGFGDLPAPPPAWRQPVAHLVHYLAIMVIGATGLMVLVFFHMAVMEIFNPDGVGLWLYPDEVGLTLSYEVQPGAREALGAAFIPVMLLVNAVLIAAIYGLWRLALSPRGPVSRWMRP